MNIKDILMYEEKWCTKMGYRNPYLDPYNHHISSSTVTGDHAAYRRFPENRHVYDKLWIAKTQHLKCGRLEELKGKEDNIKYPIFIKPRWGHLSAASKNCYKIVSYSELSKYLDYPDMMWSEFINGTEGMTDFLLLNGRIVWQITYVYSDEQNGFTDVYKFISPDTQPFPSIEQWTRDHINGHTGFVNIQYRKDKIIEAGLRPARGGMYLIGADSPALSKNIYNVIDRHFWDETLEPAITFKPFYVYKCYTKVPILYIWPQKIIDILIPSLTDMPLYEYYFEPVNNEGLVFFQFMHRDFNKGLRAKRIIELLFVTTQFLFLLTFLFIIYTLITCKGYYSLSLLFLFIGIWLTRFLNPMYVNYNNYKAYMQRFIGKESLTSQKEFDMETSDKLKEKEKETNNLKTKNYTALL
jgi:hypothetical protein